MIKRRFLEFINKIKHLSLKQIIILSVCAVLIIVYIALGAISTSIIDSLVDQNEGDRWENEEMEMAQINVYFTEQNAVSESDIQKYEYNLTQNLTGADLVADTSENSSSRIYADCYSASGSATIVHGTKTLEVSAYGVGGDFFMFHPLTLISGSYFTSDSMMEDNIVIDEITAWQLFGSSNIVGEQVLIGDVPHFISGVVRNDDDKFSKAAGLTGAIVYMSYDSMAKYGSITSGVTSSSDTGESEEVTGGINCYQVVMPNPVDNFAASFVSTALSLSDGGAVLVDSSMRFRNSNFWNIITTYGYRSMHTIPIVYPYWENIARAWEDILSLYFLIRIICIGIPIIVLVIFIIQSYRHKKWTAKGVWQKLMDYKYDIESDLKYHKQKWKYF